jgi:RecA/RadA recombinase
MGRSILRDGAWDGRGTIRRTKALTPSVLNRAARVQERGGVTAIVDCTGELGVRDVFAGSRVRRDEILVSVPDTARQAHEIAQTLKRSGAVNLIQMIGCSRRSK